MELPNLSITKFAVLYVTTLGLLGPATTLLFFRGADSAPYLYLLGRNSEQAVLVAYFWLLYGLSVVSIFYCLYARQHIEKYEQLPVIEESSDNYRLYWTICVIGLTACGAILFFQNHFSHPLVDALRLSPEDYTYARIRLSYTVNPVIYAVGQYIFSASALILAFRYLRGGWVKAVSVLLFLFLGTFSLAKAPMAVTLLEVLIVTMLLKPIRSAAILIVPAATLTGILFFLTSGNNNIESALLGITLRIFLGEFADLPSYLEVFREHGVSALSALPPYIKEVFEIDLLPPSKLVNISGDPEVLKYTVGTANTFFIGEAFAVAGLPGIIISPFIVSANIVVIVRYFSSCPKTLLNAAIFGYLVFKLLTGLFSGVSVYIISSVQIIFLTHLICSWLVHKSRQLAKMT